MSKKKCGKCKIKHPKENFYKDKNAKDGLRHWCKSCCANYRNTEKCKTYQKKYKKTHKKEISISGRAYRKKNTEKITAYQKLYSEVNKESISIRNKIYYDDHKEESLAYSKLWLKNNPKKRVVISKKYSDTHKEEISARSKEWRKNNSEKLAVQGKKYRDAHKEEIAIRGRIWRKANPDKVAISFHKRRARKESLPDKLTKDEWQEILETFNYGCVYCGDDWEHQDHFIPLSNGGGYTKENIVPACAKCNLSKGVKMPECFCTVEKYNEIINKIMEMI